MAGGGFAFGEAVAVGEELVVFGGGGVEFLCFKFWRSWCLPGVRGRWGFSKMLLLFLFLTKSLGYMCFFFCDLFIFLLHSELVGVKLYA